MKKQRKYNLSFAELIDRLNIVQSKQVYSKDTTNKFSEEISEILHDVQLHINEGVLVTSDIIRAIVVLTQANLAIWINEDFIRENENGMDDAKTAKALKFTHKLNGTRSQAKTQIQNLIGGRVDPKINCLAENSAWQIKW